MASFDGCPEVFHALLIVCAEMDEQWGYVGAKS
ncbi:TPA: hypothetical protein QDV62_004592, partial [Escherichia coli]|nr:hypothetical protein [Escherichia coli]HAK9818596.1 hypothetical protein [Escherichia coli]HBM9747157.1 hypothetical protein [Escherichia coli]HCD4976033.1 hypothetical protein [Escherichia coli]HCD7211502.1 hypothetical protein [Escherichia coli]